MFKKVGILIMAAVLSVGLAGCGGSTATSAIPIEIEMENGGIIKAELYPDIAPITVKNFTKLIDKNFFDGLIFHRVIPEFMIQGGGMDASGKSREASSIKGEFQKNGVSNSLLHKRGTLSMARTSEPNSASSQFFICVVDTSFLDGEYAAFGMVTEGMDVADEIVNVERNASDKPLENQVIKTIRRAK